jgi:hypothetical protein
MTTGQKPYWHIHHDILFEWTTDIQKRIDYSPSHFLPILKNGVSVRLSNDA